MSTTSLRARLLFFLALALTLITTTSLFASEEGGNNLSFPVIWAEGVAVTLPGEPGVEPVLDGNWWYWWGTTPEGDPLSCPPDPQNNAICEDGSSPGGGAVRVFVQQDTGNVWQAGTADWSAAPVDVTWIDWGDNLEAVDWNIRSMVRTEVVLLQDLAPEDAMTEYLMRHLSGLGINEMWGVETTGNPPVAQIVDPNLQATIFSPCARLTIQRLNVLRDDARLSDLVWVPGIGWTEGPGVGWDLINPAIFNQAVHEAGDGPGFYNAEVNVKGKVIFGYTWNVRNLNEGEADYRVTYSFDGTCDTVSLNTFFTDGITQIMLPDEGEAVLPAVLDEGQPPVGGGEAILDCENNLTYIDVRIGTPSGNGGSWRSHLPVIVGD